MTVDPNINDEFPVEFDDDELLDACDEPVLIPQCPRLPGSQLRPQLQRRRGADGGPEAAISTPKS